MKFRAVVVGVAVAALALSGCANRQQRAMQQAYAQKESAVRGYVQSQLPLANAGKIKQSDYWLGLYNVEQRDPMRTSDLIAAKGANQMIEAAQQLEAGKIGQPEYEAKRRQVQLEVGQEYAAAKERYDTQQAQQQQANKALMMQYYLNTRPVTTNCFGNSCTTY